MEAFLARLVFKSDFQMGDESSEVRSYLYFLASSPTELWLRCLGLTALVRSVRRINLWY